MELFVHNLFHNGNEVQKAKYLAKTVTGEWIGGMGGDSTPSV